MKQYSADITAAAHATMQAINNAAGPNSQFEAVADAILAERQRIAGDLFNRAGFMLCEGGEKPRVTISFKTMGETNDFHNALVKLSTFRPSVDPKGGA